MEHATPHMKRGRGRPRYGDAPLNGRTIMLPDDLHAWGMGQPEGLSALVRNLLQREQTHRQGPACDAELCILQGKDLHAKRAIIAQKVGLSIARLECLDIKSPRYLLWLTGQPYGILVGKRQDIIRQITWERLAFENGGDAQFVSHLTRPEWHAYRDAILSLAEKTTLE
jgi:hypothetical protein